MVFKQLCLAQLAQCWGAGIAHRILRAPRTPYLHGMGEGWAPGPRPEMHTEPRLAIEDSPRMEGLGDGLQERSLNGKAGWCPCPFLGPTSPRRAGRRAWTSTVPASVPPTLPQRAAPRVAHGAWPATLPQGPCPACAVALRTLHGMTCSLTPPRSGCSLVEGVGCVLFAFIRIAKAHRKHSVSVC